MKVELEEIAKRISEASAIEMELVWLPKIMEGQTDEEKDKLASILDNRVGLNGTDAPYVTSLYNQVKSGKHLSEKQVTTLRRILPKYKRQYYRMMKNTKEQKEKKQEVKESSYDSEEGTCWDDDFGEDYD